MAEPLREHSKAALLATTCPAEAADFDATEVNATCLVCDETTGPADFEAVDDEFDVARPLCPACQLGRRLRSATCEFCDAPAEYEVEFGFLCGEHHDHYTDGYREHE